MDWSRPGLLDLHEADDTKRNQVFKKVTAVCGEPKKWATPASLQNQRSGHPCHGMRKPNMAHGVLEFTTIDTVIR